MKFTHEEFNKQVEAALSPEEGDSANAMLKKMIGNYQNKKLVNTESFPQNDNGSLPANNGALPAETEE